MGKGYQQPAMNTTLLWTFKSVAWSFAHLCIYRGLLFIDPNSLTHPHFLRYQVNGITELLHWWQHSLEYQSWKTKRKGRISKKHCGNLTKSQLETEGEVMERRCILSSQISICVRKVNRELLKDTSIWGKQCPCFLQGLRRTLQEGKHKGLQRQNKYLALCWLFPSLKLQFFVLFMPSWPHLTC